MVGWMGGVAQGIVDFLVDERCQVCAAPVRAHDTATNESSQCHPLTVPVRVGIGSVHVTTRLLCAACAMRTRAWGGPVRLDASRLRLVSNPVWNASDTEPVLVYPAFATGDVLLRLIHLLKFDRRERLATWFAHAVSNGFPRHALDDAPSPTLLVPVPMDRRSLRRRGFNQAERIALELGRVWHVPVARRALCKTRRTRAQSSLGRGDRARNLERALAPGSESVAGATVVIVDDLVTTGATVMACAAVLRRAGARSVRVACIGYRP